MVSSLTVSITPEFDRFIGYGLQSGTLVHVYGPFASGKTNMALLATLNASKRGYKVVYIDPEGGFSTDRLKQISGDSFNEVLSKVLLIEPTSFEEQNVAVQRLDELVSKDSSVGLVVVDSIAMLYRLQEDKDVRELGRMLAQLLRISRRYNIPVLMTNQVYTDIDSGKNIPVGGDAIKYWCKISVELEKNSDYRIAILQRHKFMESGSRLDFKINATGIKAFRLTSPSGSVVAQYF